MTGQGLRHRPVMLKEAVQALSPHEDGRYLDATFGRGGHAGELLQRLGEHGCLLLLDRDPDAVAAAREAFAGDARVRIRHASFADMREWNEVTAGVDGVLMDLGVSSPQLDDACRGFSFMADAPLDMRMDPGAGESAAQFLASAGERQIADAIWRYGEERMSRRIARAIVRRRTEQPITRTGELADLVARIVGHRERGKHPATRTFQGLRIHVNDELGGLERGLAAAVECLNPGGRLVVISFHSLEDRIVKRFIRAESGARPVAAGPRGLPRPESSARLRPIGRARRPSAAEIDDNARARSSVMRVAERLP